MNPTSDSRMTPLPASDGEDALRLGDYLALFWDGRYWIAGTALAAALAGGAYAWLTPPTYRVKAMVQVESKKAGKGMAALSTMMDGLMDVGTEAQAEVEILQSDLVLGRTVEDQKLDLVAEPRLAPVVGKALARGREPRLEVEAFEQPTALRGVPFEVVVNADGSYRLLDGEGGLLGSARPGDPLKATWHGQPLALKVREIRAQAGQRFHLERRPMEVVLEGLRGNLSVAEKGKQTNIIGLTLQGTSPVRTAEVLNEVLEQYVRQNIERKAEEASKTLAFLQDQMPLLKGKLEVAEEKLNGYRAGTGSVDLPEEAKVVLKQTADLETQVVALRQKREEAKRTYREESSVVKTLDQQIAALQGEARKLEGSVRSLPHTQQEVLRLMRDVQVNQELYTAMLNQSQQLQAARAGEVGSARIVDHATVPLRPVAPEKGKILGLSLLLGLFGGAGLVLLRRALHNGVEDPAVIEGRLGLPVVASIPQSLVQMEALKRGEARELLAHRAPDDLAVESLRSLRTSLHFTMLEARNNAILISGPAPGIGKSFVNANLAAVMAQTGDRVLLVDADMRKGHLHLAMGLERREGGFSEVLAGSLPWREAVREVKGLHFIPTGAIPPNPSELLASRHLPAFLEAACADFDYVIIDAPPVLAVTDAVMLGKHVGTTLLLAKSGAHPVEELQDAFRRLDQGGTQLKGCVLNAISLEKAGSRHYRYAYHYQYGKASR